MITPLKIQVSIDEEDLVRYYDYFYSRNRGWNPIIFSVSFLLLYWSFVFHFVLRGEFSWHPIGNILFFVSPFVFLFFAPKIFRSIFLKRVRRFLKKKEVEDSFGIKKYEFHEDFVFFLSSESGIEIKTPWKNFRFDETDQHIFLMSNSFSHIIPKQKLQKKALKELEIFLQEKIS
jgi:hypothetical protein